MAGYIIQSVAVTSATPRQDDPNISDIGIRLLIRNHLVVQDDHDGTLPEEGSELLEITTGDTTHNPSGMLNYSQALSDEERLKFFNEVSERAMRGNRDDERISVPQLCLFRLKSGFLCRKSIGKEKNFRHELRALIVDLNPAHILFRSALEAYARLCLCNWHSHDHPIQSLLGRWMTELQSAWHSLPDSSHQSLTHQMLNKPEHILVNTDSLRDSKHWSANSTRQEMSYQEPISLENLHPHGTAFMPYSNKPIYAALHRAIIGPTPESSDSGHIYILWHPNFPDFVKIGSSIQPKHRLIEWNNSCMLESLEPSYHCPVVPSAFRVESLIRADLAAVRLLQNNCRCKIRHNEWFKISQEDAIKVVDYWVKWMTELRPYDGHRLKKEFILYTFAEVVPDMDPRVKLFLHGFRGNYWVDYRNAFSKANSFEATTGTRPQPVEACASSPSTTARPHSIGRSIPPEATVIKQEETGRLRALSADTGLTTSTLFTARTHYIADRDWTNRNMVEMDRRIVPETPEQPNLWPSNDTPMVHSSSSPVVTLDQNSQGSLLHLRHSLQSGISLGSLNSPVQTLDESSGAETFPQYNSNADVARSFGGSDEEYYDALTSYWNSQPEQSTANLDRADSLAMTDEEIEIDRRRPDVKQEDRRLETPLPCRQRSFVLEEANHINDIFTPHGSDPIDENNVKHSRSDIERQRQIDESPLPRRRSPRLAEIRSRALLSTSPNLNHLDQIESNNSTPTRNQRRRRKTDLELLTDASKASLELSTLDATTPARRPVSHRKTRSQNSVGQSLTTSISAGTLGRVSSDVGTSESTPAQSWETPKRSNASLRPSNSKDAPRGQTLDASTPDRSSTPQQTKRREAKVPVTASKPRASAARNALHSRTPVATPVRKLERSEAALGASARKAEHTNTQEPPPQAKTHISYKPDQTHPSSHDPSQPSTPGKKPPSKRTPRKSNRKSNSSPNVNQPATPTIVVVPPDLPRVGSAPARLVRERSARAGYDDSASPDPSRGSTASVQQSRYHMRPRPPTPAAAMRTSPLREYDSLGDIGSIPIRLPMTTVHAVADTGGADTGIGIGRDVGRDTDTDTDTDNNADADADRAAGSSSESPVVASRVIGRSPKLTRERGYHGEMRSPRKGSD